LREGGKEGGGRGPEGSVRFEGGRAAGLVSANQQQQQRQQQQQEEEKRDKIRKRGGGNLRKGRGGEISRIEGGGR